MVWLSTWSLTQKETPLSAPCIHVLRKRRFPHHAITCSENMLFLKLTGLHRRDELPTSFDQQASGSAVIRSYHLGASSEGLNCRSCNWTRRECVTHSPKSRQTSFCLRSMRCAERSARLRRRLSRLNSRQEHRRIAYRGIGAAYGANYAGCHRRCGGVEGCRALHIGAPQRFLQCGAYVRADLAGANSGATCRMLRCQCSAISEQVGTVGSAELEASARVRQVRLFKPAEAELGST